MNLISLSTTIPMLKEESKYNTDQTKLAPEEEGPFELKVGEVVLRVKFKYAQDDLEVYVTNDSSVKTLKCVVESYVMAHKVGKKLINSMNLNISPKALLSWKIQEQKFFAHHCLSKRQQRNEKIVRFRVKIFLEIKSWSVEEVEETLMDDRKLSCQGSQSSTSSFSKTSFAGKTILAKVDNVQKCTQRYYLHLIDCCNTQCLKITQNSKSVRIKLKRFSLDVVR